MNKPDLETPSNNLMNQSSFQKKQTLRLMTCGSVDDGKSTFIGRLLYENQSLYEDQIASLEKDSKVHGYNRAHLDFALLLDGLKSEREQGITIDVAYRHFATEKRRYIVADCPGHEQYTRNMATAASTADVAVLLVDVRSGIRPQTLRHAKTLAMMGCPQVILAVNKMDLVDFDQRSFDAVAQSFARASVFQDFKSVYSIPISARDGDHLITPSSRLLWFDGPPLLTYLDLLPLSKQSTPKPFTMPVQIVIRPHMDFRGYAGTVSSGRVKRGDPVKVWPSGIETRVTRILRGFEDRDVADGGEALTLTFADEVDVGRGSLVAHLDANLSVRSRFKANLIWMNRDPLVQNRPYLLRIQTTETGASVLRMENKENFEFHRTDVLDHKAYNYTGAMIALNHLAFNDIARVEIQTDVPIVFETYRENRALGSFILIDKKTFATVAAGMIVSDSERYGAKEGESCQESSWKNLEITKVQRASLKHQKPRCLWFTGLPSSGKSTLAGLLEKRLVALGMHTYLLDGDNLRLALNKDLSFDDKDRRESIRRTGEIARLMVDAGLVVLVSLISPFRREREKVRALFESDEFTEIYVKTPLEVCEKRDPKGLYKKARMGLLKDFTGLSSAYEPPEKADLEIDTSLATPVDCAAEIFNHVFKIS